MHVGSLSLEHVGSLSLDVACFFLADVQALGCEQYVYSSGAMSVHAFDECVT